jgi:hypothetical protein
MAAIGGIVVRGGNHDNIRVWNAKERATGYLANVSQLICNQITLASREVL